MKYIMDGVININKAVGPTSFQVVQAVKRILRIKKAGHIGTLDPLACGVLPICLNQSTKIIPYLNGLPKKYTGTLRLGVVTDTQDSTGNVIETHEVPKLDKGRIEETLDSFLGAQEQVPPMYSAKKRNGVPLYKLARKGIVVDRKPASIYIYRIEMKRFEGHDITIEVECSAGTYLRTLIHDFGQKLGCGAHMTQLIRNRVEHFDLENAITLEHLEDAKSQGSVAKNISSKEQALSFIPNLEIKTRDLKALMHGVPLSKSSVVRFPDRFQPGMNFRVCDENQHLVALVEPTIPKDLLEVSEQNDIIFKLKRVFN